MPAARGGGGAAAAAAEGERAAEAGTAGGVTQWYAPGAAGGGGAARLLARARSGASPRIAAIHVERCFNVQVQGGGPLPEAEARALAWLLGGAAGTASLSRKSTLPAPGSRENCGGIVEVGPRMNFSTAWSSNAVSICRSCGVASISRIEPSRRFSIEMEPGAPALSASESEAFAALVHDRMTECVYPAPLKSFASDVVPAPVERAPVMAEGRAALERLNGELGLAFDDWDLDYYTNLFRVDLGRDPTTVELFDIAQSNSEHSRHWFFKGDLTVDGHPVGENLLDIVRDTLKAQPNNSVIAYKDNSSAIRGGVVRPLLPESPGQPGSPLAPQPRDYDLLLTAETHNFPCAVAPYPGAETGAGGRIRDTHATGRGSIMGMATAGYCTGNLNMAGSRIAGEDPSFEYPDNLAPPLQILIDASNGASDYGNKFGEPLVQGYCRTFGQRLPSGDRREWLKPIMFSGALGQIDHAHLEKEEPEVGMLVVKIGGPAYRIGMGGGAASSLASGSNKAELDFNAVQRGDGEMAQKLWRTVRACVEMGDANPIVSLHDQGAGGNCNVVKEIIYPKGAEIDIRAVKVGDATMSVLEIWSAEYQENDCLLIKPEDRSVLEAICERERSLMSVIGTINGSGRVVLRDSRDPDGPPPEDLELEMVLGDLPNKKYDLARGDPTRTPVTVPVDASVTDLLDQVLRLPSVCSKRFLTTKVDRHVTGLVAQQQCVGPLQLPVADVAVMAQTHQDLKGAVCSIGEQPIKGLVDPAAMARMAVGESLTNMVWARISALNEVKCSVNWMYAAKLGNEGAAMYDAAVALRDVMLHVGLAVDGGKDSLSMAAAAPGGENVLCPGNLVVSNYAPCPDITMTVTPDLKLGERGRLLFIDLAAGRRRLGGSALAQALGQVGDSVPDMEDPGMFKHAFELVQTLLSERLVRAGHDVSDGGLVTALLEMAFAGNCGLNVDLPNPSENALEALFAEELGLVLEVAANDVDSIAARFDAVGVPCHCVGSALSFSRTVTISVGGEKQVEGDVGELRDVWEATSFQLEREQSAEACVAQEEAGLQTKRPPEWRVTYESGFSPDSVLAATDKIKVAVVREEGSNGDREMAAALYAAGFQPADVTMSDLLDGSVSLGDFRGCIFVGGFSYADVMESSRGWAGTIRFNKDLQNQFQNFYMRPDTFSLGVCNGCQLMALLGWVGDGGAGGDTAADGALHLGHNDSGRFESRFAHVRIGQSPSIMLSGMEDSVVGVWCAHGEGKFTFTDEATRSAVESAGLVTIQYCDSSGKPTEAYPENPNGSPGGIAGLCSPDGRHLAMMPHPERCFLGWQLPWSPESAGFDPAGPGPWLKMFQNAREWAEKH